MMDVLPWVGLGGFVRATSLLAMLLCVTLVK